MMAAITIVFNLLTLSSQSVSSSSGPSMFIGEMPNITVSTGREAVFTCIIDNVYSFKVAFLRVDTQTILAIDDTVITRSARVTVRHSIDKDERSTTGQRKTWQLYLKEVTPADAGGYMCQLNNFEPMVSQVAYLHVTVPPDILVNESSSDLTIKEGGNATLKCSAIGYPEPNITWRREDYQPIDMNQSVTVLEGSILNLVSVHRRQMAPYLCIASNGIPPPVSKRILLRVEFAPAVTSHQSEVFQRLGEPLKLHCQCHCWPQGYTSWTYESNRLPSERAAVDYRPQVGLVVTDMYLSIADMQPRDKGHYTCHCSNIYGTANWTISVEGLVVDAVQQRRMAHSSWSAEHQGEEGEQSENEDDFSSPPPRTTARQTATVQLSITDATTRKTIDANYRLTQAPKRSEDGSPLLRQQKQASNKAGIPTSLTSKASESISNLFLLLSLITLLIDNQHRQAR